MSIEELELPFDFHALGTSPRTQEGDPFDLKLRAAVERPECFLAALFCIQLFRYNSQANLSLSFSTFCRDQKRSGTRQLDLAITVGTTLGDVLREVTGSQQAGQSARAVVSWVEPGFAEDAKRAHLEADLHLIVTEVAGVLRALFIYKPDRFKPETIARLARHLKTLSEAATRLDVPIAQLPLLDSEELNWLESIGEGRTGMLSGELVHRIVEEQARIRPDSVALRYRQSSMTYRELNEQSNRLARHLIAIGVSAEDRIIVRMTPCSEVIVALLGILKAGAVYVPIDPTYPETRIQAILEDTKPVLILTREAYREIEQSIGGHPGTNLNRVIHPQQTAYIYYTSGTTGRPKGAMASHANLSSYIQVARERYGFNDSDVVPAIARLSFSISMFELMTVLSSGGTLVMLDREHVLDPVKMTQTLSESTLFHAGPSLLKILIPYIRQTCADLSRFSRVRHASSGGDMIAPEVLEGMKEIFPNAEVFVIYGCSEIACMGCTYPVPRDHKVKRTYVGRPFDGMTVRVLDSAGNVVPTGIVGEIHFSGGGVVKGYLGLDELTLEKFVMIRGQRYYRTGDLGRFSDDGWLEILGRSDFQVKIRGMRVELGEVDYNLLHAPGVRDGTTVAKDGPGGEKILVAYIVPAEKDGKTARISAIRRYLEERLPDYMVPGVFVELEKMPLNHNMKLDRKALPPLNEADFRVRLGGSDLAPLRKPETPTEKALAELWKRLLKVEQVGIDDRFFELGGDSLLAIHLLVALEKELGITLDGMDVLRESLEVLATLCSQTHVQRTPVQTKESFETFYFGNQLSLYGVLQRASLNNRDQALLICPPVGVESVRSGFIVRQLVRRLAARGTSVMYFDYFGCGDSIGPSAVEALDRWVNDVVEAYKELQNRTQSKKINGLGIRLGAPLLCQASKQITLSDFFFWDPVRKGSEYLSQVLEAQRRYLLAKDLGRAARVRQEEGEILGLTYSQRALSELRALSLNLPSSNRVEVVDQGLEWCDIARIDQNFSDTGISKHLASLVGEDK